ncbi:hypothetical protein BLX24_13835 [Arsenicibacter rosenii]|uniref:Xylose isomerase-like TIM barrel domain-containing protein n=2 Tax=Arsenicibacter rosenii TaxID=1750698 RepID=A0A1S2VJ47_9BACT|nr:hypothetical protein BLX24_13835 [Arsenicibacter rosenii]
MHILQAGLPLFASEQVAALEWSFDSLYAQTELPDWFDELLLTYGQANRLVGHGVFFSIFAGRWRPEQQTWLNQLADRANRYRFDHVTEHFGFMTGASFHAGAPMSVPLNTTTLRIGQDRLHRIQQAAGCAVGLENLALAYSLDDVKRQGDFLHQLLAPVDGLLIMDLHNLYCQSHNFGVDWRELLALYPLDRIREIHLSGGSWEDSISEPGRIIRRDTHDEAVPGLLFDWLPVAIDQCPNLKYVVLEQLGRGLVTDAARLQYQADFTRIANSVAAHPKASVQGPAPAFRPETPVELPAQPLEDETLAWQQQHLTTILETAGSAHEARQQLAASPLAHSDWGTERWQPAMLETALRIAQKWTNGFSGLQ